MSPHAGTMLLAGSANLLLAGAWMFGALLGSFTRVSSGCLRLTNEDVADLYSRVHVGTKVIVLPMDRRAELIAR